MFALVKKYAGRASVWTRAIKAVAGIYLNFLLRFSLVNPQQVLPGVEVASEA